MIETRSVTAETPHPGDLVDPALVRMMSGVPEGCRRMREAGFALVVVSNQGCVARGVGTVEQVEAVNARMAALLRVEGVVLDGVYYCPYHPKGTVAPYNVEHDWRKPAPGMVLAAAAALRLDLTRSWLIGDSERDVQAGVAAGVDPDRAILLGSAGGRTFADAAVRVVGGG